MSTETGIHVQIVLGIVDPTTGEVLGSLEDMIRKHCKVETLHDLQTQVNDWQQLNFGATNPRSADIQFRKIVEELGELANALVYQEQFIGGTHEQWEIKIQDAIVDIVIALTGFCFRKGYDIAYLIQEVWPQVQQRDYREEISHNKRREAMRELMTAGAQRVLDEDSRRSVNNLDEAFRVMEEGA